MSLPAGVRALIWLSAPRVEAEALLGDLEEEGGGVRWFWSQALRSTGPLLAVRWRSGELPLVTLLALLAGGLALLSLDRLWAFVFSQVPLKDGLERPEAVLWFNFLFVTAANVAAGRVLRSAPVSQGARSAVAFAAASGMSAVVGLAGSLAEAPWPHALAVALVAPAIASALFVTRRGRRGGSIST